MRQIMLLCCLIFCFPVAAQKVYKTVDEDGNTVYTDQPPDAQAQPLEMAPISVVETNSQESFRSGAATGTGNPDVASRVYGDLKVLEPTPDQTYWGSGGTVVIRLQADQSLANGHQINYFFDGAAAGTTSSMTQMFAEVVRGAHQVRAEIVDANGKVLSTSPSVTFHMKQQSQLNPNRPVKRSNSPLRGRQGN